MYALNRRLLRTGLREMFAKMYKRVLRLIHNPSSHWCQKLVYFDIFVKRY